ncbi:MAG: hypothetical protein OER43_13760 [Gammaproteobacteria bacterium]|nr:hypothetical protein [Gammaproteobacteria bacterium]MDH3413612.1 hypothetical protein [Gammaproteobacteria bacterium]
MKTAMIITLSASVMLIAAQAGGAPSQFSEQRATGHSNGNHALDCTVIRPWSDRSDSGGALYPLIAWANGWDQGNVVGATTTLGYKPGLIEWALDGPYIVIAANQWSVQESDVLQCIQWLADQTMDPNSEYYGVADMSRIGLAGHSQGGGAVIKAGDGEPNGFDITAVVAMNPYGPGWVDTGNQDGPMMLIGGTDDTTTPVSSFIKVWEAVQENEQGGLLAVLEDGTHNDDAWAPADDFDNPQNYDFGRYQRITELWWQFHLNGKVNVGRQLKRELTTAPWSTEFSDNFSF